MCCAVLPGMQLGRVYVNMLQALGSMRAISNSKGLLQLSGRAVEILDMSNVSQRKTELKGLS